jgi:hypothetical protein
VAYIPNMGEHEYAVNILEIYFPEVGLQFWKTYHLDPTRYSILNTPV